MSPHRALIGVSLLSLALLAPALSEAQDLPQPVPEVLEGFEILPLVPIPAPTALAFGPGGPDLYATTLTGDVARVSLTWTPAGPLATGMSTYASGFSQPLGLVFQGSTLYVSDSHPGTESGRTDGRITRLDSGQTTQAAGTVIVDGLPNGRHNANHLRLGPDGRLYAANGNSTDNGIAGGDPETPPYSGSILSVDLSAVNSSPATLHWVTDPSDPAGQRRIPAPDLNFTSKVQVYAHGFRNVFGIAFSPAGVGYTAMNGPDDPSAQDALFKIIQGTDYGFPFCYNVGTPGSTGADVHVENNPLFPTANCTGVSPAVVPPPAVPPPPATALLGWHTCTTGLDFPSTPSLSGFSPFPAGFRSSAFVSECTAFFAEDLAQRILDDPANASHSTAHKVVRVALDGNGDAEAVNDFVTGLVLATDTLFGPDGAMYIADVEMTFRVAPLLPAANPSSAEVSVFTVGFSFVPAVLTVPRGTTVVWHNDLPAGAIPHTVTSSATPQDALSGSPDGRFDRTPLAVGATFSQRFDESGVFPYFCGFHVGLGMVGTIVVQ